MTKSDNVVSVVNKLVHGIEKKVEIKIEDQSSFLVHVVKLAFIQLRQMFTQALI